MEADLANLRLALEDCVCGRGPRKEIEDMQEKREDVGKVANSLYRASKSTTGLILQGVKVLEILEGSPADESAQIQVCVCVSDGALPCMYKL